MKIAVYVDRQGEVARVSDPGAVLLFEQSGGTWHVRKSIRLAVRPSESLAGVQADVAAAVDALEDCRVFLSGDVRGVVNTLLQERGIQTWQSDGPLFRQLETVARREDERSAQAAAAARAERRRCKRRRHSRDGIGDPAAVSPQPDGAPADGRYRLDLVEALAADPSLTSWDVLVPFLTGTRFEKLEIVCDHLPRWFRRAMRALDLVAEVESVSSDAVVVTVVPRRMAAAAPVREERLSDA